MRGLETTKRVESGNDRNTIAAYDDSAKIAQIELGTQKNRIPTIYIEHEPHEIIFDILRITQSFRPEATEEEARLFYEAFFEGYISKTAFSRRKTTPTAFVQRAFEAQACRQKRAKISELSQRLRCKPELYRLLGLGQPKPYSQNKDDKYQDLLKLVRRADIECMTELKTKEPALYNRLTHYGWIDKCAQDLQLDKFREYASVKYLYDYVRSENIRDWSEIHENHPRLFNWAIKMLQPHLVSYELGLTDQHFLITTYADVDGAIDFFEKFKIKSAKECKERFSEFYNKLRYSGIYLAVSEAVGWPDSLTRLERIALGAITKHNFTTPEQIKEHDPRLWKWIKVRSSINVLLSRRRNSYSGKRPELTTLLEKLEAFEAEVKTRNFSSINQLRYHLPNLHKEAVKLKIFGHLTYRLNLKLEAHIPSTDLIDKAIAKCGGDIAKLQREDRHLYALVRKRNLMLNIEKMANQ